MTAMGIPANAKQLAALVKEGEGPALEFKRSTGELKEGMQTLCAFLNDSGGMVLFGVVTFRAPLVAGGAAGTSTSETGDQVTAEVTAQVTAEVTAQVAAFCREPQPAKAIMAELGLKHSRKG
jgi:predicted HTH transcriptional regulator